MSATLLTNKSLPGITCTTMNILRGFLSRSRPHFSPSPRWVDNSKELKELIVRSIATLIPSVSSTAKTCTPRNLISSGGDLLRFSSSASVSTQQDQAAWCLQGYVEGESDGSD